MDDVNKLFDQRVSLCSTVNEKTTEVIEAAFQHARYPKMTGEKTILFIGTVKYGLDKWVWTHMHGHNKQTKGWQCLLPMTLNDELNKCSLMLITAMLFLIGCWDREQVKSKLTYLAKTINHVYQWLIMEWSNGFLCFPLPQSWDPQPVHWSERVWPASTQWHWHENQQRVCSVQGNT